MCRAQLTVPKDEIAMPFIRSASTGHHDKLYRDMERGSEVRAQAAADMLGVSTADVSDLKITNLRDTHEGEMAHVPIVNEVSKMMDKAPDATGFQPQAAGYSGAVQGGPFPNSGARFQTKVREFHAQKAGWGAMSDNPANEVMSPSYRKRAQ